MKKRKICIEKKLTNYYEDDNRICIITAIKQQVNKEN